MRKPTTLRKVALIHEIVGILCGELTQERNKRGAPIKDVYIDPQLIGEVERLKNKYLYNGAKNETVRAWDPSAEEKTAEPDSVQFVVRLSDLNEEQKQLLKAFIQSL